nr:hypothetical protein [Haladaptatus sp. R4]
MTGVAGDPDPYHGVHPMADDARERFDALATNADSMPIAVRDD